MTVELEASCREVVSRRWQSDNVRIGMRALLAEIDALRAVLDAAEGRVRLPVIATCGMCPSIGYRIMAGDDRDADPIVCTDVNKSEAARATGAIVDPADVPPAWCPLRGAP